LTIGSPAVSFALLEVLSMLEGPMVLVGGEWAEDHHDVGLVGEDAKVLGRKRLPEGLDGITGLHGLVAEHMPAGCADLDPAEAGKMVRVGIETDRGPGWQPWWRPAMRCSRSTRCRRPGSH
jgi:hypothetical protein